MQDYLFGVEGVFDPVEVFDAGGLLLDQQCVKAQCMMGETLICREVEEGSPGDFTLLAAGN